MKYNERIREIKENNSLTHQKIADLLHIRQWTYTDYENGKTKIPVDNLLILTRFYNVSMDYITGANNFKSEKHRQQHFIFMMLLPVVFLIIRNI